MPPWGGRAVHPDHPGHAPGQGGQGGHSPSPRHSLYLLLPYPPGCSARASTSETTPTTLTGAVARAVSPVRGGQQHWQALRPHGYSSTMRTTLPGARQDGPLIVGWLRICWCRRPHPNSRSPPSPTGVYLETHGSGYAKLDRGNGGGKPTFSDGQRGGFVNRSDRCDRPDHPDRCRGQGGQPGHAVQHRP